MSNENESVYLGDAVYASFDGYHIWLHTSNGVETSNEIALEPPVYKALVRYAQSIPGNRTRSFDTPDLSREARVGRALIDGGYLDRLLDMTPEDNAERIIREALPKLQAAVREEPTP